MSTTDCGDSIPNSPWRWSSHPQEDICRVKAKTNEELGRAFAVSSPHFFCVVPPKMNRAEDENATAQVVYVLVVFLALWFFLGCICSRMIDFVERKER